MRPARVTESSAKRRNNCRNVDPEHLSGPRVQLAGHVVFLILPGRPHSLLVAWQHPVPADPRIERFLAGRQPRQAGLDGPHAARLPAGFQRATVGRAMPQRAPGRRTSARPCVTHPHAGNVPQLARDQLLRPGGPRPAIVLGRPDRQGGEGGRTPSSTLAWPLSSRWSRKPSSPSGRNGCSTLSTAEGLKPTASAICSMPLPAAACRTMRVGLRTPASRVARMSRCNRRCSPRQSWAPALAADSSRGVLTQWALKTEMPLHYGAR